MNQYPGFVPMMMPRPYMVALPVPGMNPGMTPGMTPGMPPPPQSAGQALIPGIPLQPGAAAAAAAAAAASASPAGVSVTASGLSVNPALQGISVGSTSHQLNLAAANPHLSIAAAAMPQYNPAALPQITQMSQMSPALIAATLNSRKRTIHDVQGYPVQQGLQPGLHQGMIEAEQFAAYGIAPPPAQDVSTVTLDDFNSDLHLVHDEDGYGGAPLSDPSGFCFTWAGARATHGAVRGKIYFEVQITEELPTDFGDDHQETDPHVIRVGWSIDSHSFQLGEDPFSYGYGGTGKFSVNLKFSNYGERFGLNDVIGSMIDLDSQPPAISFSKNGTWLGVASTLKGLIPGKPEMALFPHVLSKNTRFKVNFGQEAPWYPPPLGYAYICQVPLTERVRGLQPPERKADCEMLMIIGLPGAGKTTWGINMRRDHPEKRYNIIGTDTLIDKMKVMGLPRKNNYHGRWDVLIDKATKCLNKLFLIASKRNRNYILDQTNVYPSARKRKMKSFHGFMKRGCVLQPDDAELKRREHKRTYEDGKFVPESAVLQMKANYKLPEENDPLFDMIDYVELPRKECVVLVEGYNREGSGQAQPPKPKFAENRFQPPSEFKQGSQWQQQPAAAKPPPPPQYIGGMQFYQQGDLTARGYASQPPPPPTQPQAWAQGDLYAAHGLADIKSEPPEKKGRYESSSGLDFIKQQYEGAEAEQDQQALSQWPQQDMRIKDEPKWRGEYGIPYSVGQTPQQLGQPASFDYQSAYAGKPYIAQGDSQRSQRETSQGRLQGLAFPVDSKEKDYGDQKYGQTPGQAYSWKSGTQNSDWSQQQSSQSSRYGSQGSRSGSEGSGIQERSHGRQNQGYDYQREGHGQDSYGSRGKDSWQGRTQGDSGRGSQTDSGRQSHDDRQSRGESRGDSGRGDSGRSDSGRDSGRGDSGRGDSRDSSRDSQWPGKSQRQESGQQSQYGDQHQYGRQQRDSREDRYGDRQRQSQGYGNRQDFGNRQQDFGGRQQDFGGQRSHEKSYGGSEPYGNQQKQGRDSDRGFSGSGQLDWQSQKNQEQHQGMYGRGGPEKHSEQSQWHQSSGNNRQDGRERFGSPSAPPPPQSASPVTPSSTPAAPDKPKRERRRPSKWDTPSADTPPATDSEPKDITSDGTSGQPPIENDPISAQAPPTIQEQEPIKEPSPPPSQKPEVPPSDAGGKPPSLLSTPVQPSPGFQGWKEQKEFTDTKGSMPSDVQKEPMHFEEHVERHGPPPGRGRGGFGRGGPPFPHRPPFRPRGDDGFGGRFPPGRGHFGGMQGGPGGGPPSRPPFRPRGPPDQGGRGGWGPRGGPFPRGGFRGPSRGGMPRFDRGGRWPRPN